MTPPVKVLLPVLVKVSLPAPDFVINGYTTIDLRAGVRALDNTWTVTAYARNVASKYYFTSVNFYLDTYERFAGQPAVFAAPPTARRAPASPRPAAAAAYNATRE